MYELTSCPVIEYDLTGPLIRPSSSIGLSNLKLLLRNTAFCFAGVSTADSPVNQPILADSEVGNGLNGSLDHLRLGLRPGSEILLGGRNGSSSGEAQRTSLTAGG